MSEHVKTELADRVLLIRLNRADKKNALTQAMYLAMNKALQEAATNPEVRVVVLTGSGGSFTAGNDIEDFLQVPPADDDSPDRALHADPGRLSQAGDRRGQRLRHRRGRDPAAAL